MTYTAALSLFAALSVVSLADASEIKKNSSENRAIAGATLMGDEIIWSNEPDAGGDIQAIYSKESHTWHFSTAEKSITEAILGTPLKTEGSTVGMFYSKSIVNDNFAATCFTDTVGSSGLAGNFSTAFLLVKFTKNWYSFAFTSATGCDDVDISNSSVVSIKYEQFKLTSSGRVRIKLASVREFGNRTKVSVRSIGYRERPLLKRFSPVLRELLLRDGTNSH